MFAAIVCERFGWTLDEYDRQPWHFVETIRLMIKAESRAREKAARQAGQT